MNLLLTLFGFNGIYHIKGILKFLVEGNRLLLRGLYLIVNMDMRCLVQNKAVQHFVKPSHKAYQSNICPNSKRNSKGGRHRIFHFSEQMGFGNVQYDLPVDHSSGFRISVYSLIPFKISTRSKFFNPVTTSTTPSAVLTLFPSNKNSLGILK